MIEVLLEINHFLNYTQPNLVAKIISNYMKFEKVTDTIVFNMLRVNKYVDGNFNSLDEKVKVWAHKSSNSIVNTLLSTASKGNTGFQGYPEYIVLDEQYGILIVIEDKRDIRFHKYDAIDEKVNEYAVNGVLWYASKLKENFDVIAIAVSGSSSENLMIDTYAWKKNAETFNNINQHSIKDITFYRDLLKKDEKTINSVNELKELNDHAKDLNEFLRNYMGIMEHKRLYVLGSILFALEDPVFKMSYSSFDNNKDLGEFLYQTIERKTKNSGLQRPDIIRNELKPTLEGMGTEKKGVKEEYPNGTLVELVNRVDNILFDYYKNSQLDLISIFFNVFLSYSTSGGSDLGIVLTPSHITKLFSDLAEVDINSKILDPCVGTGGFLTASWKKISSNQNYSFSQKEFFRKNNLIGVEKEHSIYTIVALNMFINKDGRSNLFCDDCFAIKEQLKKEDCTVGFVNPPYSDEIYAEIEFVELMLDALLPNSLGIAIIPVNAVSSKTKKHSGLNEIKRRILGKHKLIASIQMPTQLFYPKGTETIVVVFQTHCRHEGKTWFAKYEDMYDLIKHQKMRTPSDQSEDNYEQLIQAFKTRKETDFSFLKQIDSDDQWVYTLHKEIEYELEDQDIQRKVNDYLAYLVQNRYYKVKI